jgi:hypothetical protein
MRQKIQAIQFKMQSVFSSHQAFVVLSLLLIIATLVIFRLTSLSNLEPSAEYIDDQTRTIQPVPFNEEAIKEIQALRNSNVSNPGTQIQEDRSNPFAE